MMTTIRPWIAAITLAALATLTTGCRKDINNKEAVRVAIVDYLTKRASTTGLDMSKMDVDVNTVTFEKDSAQASVNFRVRDGGQGMEMSYALVRNGNVWEVKPKAAAEANPHGGSIPAPGPGSAFPPSGSGGELPPNHPPTGAKK